MWAQAVSRLPNEQEQGYEGLSLLLLLFESVFDVRVCNAEEEQLDPWIAYRRKMHKPPRKTIECFELPLDKRLAKPAVVIAISPLAATEH